MDEIIEYVKRRVSEVKGKAPRDAAFRHRMLALPVVLLRDEGGLTFQEIAEELGVGAALAWEVYGEMQELHK